MRRRNPAAGRNRSARAIQTGAAASGAGADLRMAARHLAPIGFSAVLPRFGILGGGGAPAGPECVAAAGDHDLARIPDPRRKFHRAVADSASFVGRAGGLFLAPVDDVFRDLLPRALRPGPPVSLGHPDCRSRPDYFDCTDSGVRGWPGSRLCRGCLDPPDAFSHGSGAPGVRHGGHFAILRESGRQERHSFHERCGAPYPLRLAGSRRRPHAHVRGRPEQPVGRRRHRSRLARLVPVFGHRVPGHLSLDPGVRDPCAAGHGRAHGHPAKRALHPVRAVDSGWWAPSCSPWR